MWPNPGSGSWRAERNETIIDEVGSVRQAKGIGPSPREREREHDWAGRCIREKVPGTRELWPGRGSCGLWRERGERADGDDPVTPIRLMERPVGWALSGWEGMAGPAGHLEMVGGAAVSCSSVGPPLSPPLLCLHLPPTHSTQPPPPITDHEDDQSAQTTQRQSRPTDPFATTWCTPPSSSLVTCPACHPLLSFPQFACTPCAPSNPIGIDSYLHSPIVCTDHRQHSRATS